MAHTQERSLLGSFAIAMTWWQGLQLTPFACVALDRAPVRKQLLVLLLQLSSGRRVGQLGIKLCIVPGWHASQYSHPANKNNMLASADSAVWEFHCQDVTAQPLLPTCCRLYTEQRACKRAGCSLWITFCRPHPCY